jgi:hypothetical protein
MVEIASDGTGASTSDNTKDDFPIDYRCLSHTKLGWVVCPLSLLYWETPSSSVAHSNHMTIYGSLPHAQLRMPQTPGLHRFVQSLMPPSKGRGLFARPIQINEDDKNIWNVLVFREPEKDWQDVSLLNSLKAHYQTYIVLKHYQIPIDNVRIWFMDDLRSSSASTSHEDAPWIQLWGIKRVGYWSDLVQKSTYISRSIIISTSPTALGEEAVLFMKDSCKREQSLLLEWRNALLHAYHLSTRHAATPLSNTSDINVLTLLYNNIDGRPHWASQDTFHAKVVLRKVYHTPQANVVARSLADMTLREQVMLLHQTDVLIYPERADAIVSLFLPPGAKYVTYHGPPSRRIEYILSALGVGYEKDHMPMALRIKGFYADTNVTNTDDRNDSHLLASCNDLLGWNAFVRNESCVNHTRLMWESCALPPLRFFPDQIAGAFGNESIKDVRGRPEALERLFFTGPGAVESAGKVDNHTYVFSSFRKIKQVKAFWDAIRPLPKNELVAWHDTPIDLVPTMLVFRESYANPCWSIIMAFQTWLTAELFHVGGKFRILWMDGHAYTGIDDFWHDIFGPDVYHFQGFVHRTGITAFQHSFLVHPGRVPLGNEGLHVYRMGDPCSPNSTLHQFRRFVLDKYGYSDERRPANHTKRLTFLIRKPYMAHPRAGGLVDRTVADVNETVKELQLRFPDHDVETVSFEGIPFRDQIATIRRTDLLVAVHGAGNMDVLFLPEHAGFIEFYPTGYMTRKRFQYIASVLDLPHRAVRGKIHRHVTSSVLEMSLAEYIKDLPDFD